MAALLALATAACAAGPGGPGAGSTAVPTGAARSAAVDDPGARPVLAFTPETVRAASGLVTADEGGSIVATGGSGAAYRLDVPAGAVAVDTEIRLTPLQGVIGLESGGPIDAVQMEPDGLQFLDVVRLTITPSRPIPVERQTMFEARGDGSDVRLALVDPSTTAMVLLFEHFTIGGVADQTSQQNAATHAKSAENADRRISDEIRDVIQEERKKQLKGESEEDVQPDLTKLVEEYRREVLDPLRKAALASCDYLQTYVVTVIRFQRQVQLLGLANDADYAATMDDARAMLDQRYEQCLNETIKRCKAARDPGILVRFWSSAADIGSTRQPKLDPQLRRTADRICNPKSFLLELSGTDLPLRTRSVNTSRTADLAGQVRGCPRDDGSIELRGEATLAYSDGAPPSSYTLLDVVGGQATTAFSLALSDVHTVEAHLQLYPPGMKVSTLSVTDPHGNPAAILTLYNGFDEHVGDFEIVAVRVDPDC